MRNGQAKISVALGLIAVGVALGQAFAPRGSLKFDAATVKPTAPGTPYEGVHPAPGGRRYIGSGLNLRSYLYVAYQVREEQIVGGPGWVDKDLFDLNAEAEKPSNIEDLHIMLQNALTEAFKLQFHFEKREMQAYVASADKGGLKNLTPRERAPGSDFVIDMKQDPPFHARWDAHCVSMDAFLWRVSGWMDRPVINNTGLDGCYDLQLHFRTDQKAVGDGLDDSGPTLEQALREQLGMKLEARRAPVETLVIDHVERPAAE